MEASREMSLDEYMARLPEFHRANKELLRTKEQLKIAVEAIEESTQELGLYLEILEQDQGHDGCCNRCLNAVHAIEKNTAALNKIKGMNGNEKA